MKFIRVVARLLAVALIFMAVGPVWAFEPLPQSLRWELLGQSGEIQYNALGYPYGVHYVQPGDTVDMWVTVKNRSTNPRGQVWYGKSALLAEGPDYPNAHAIGLGTWDPMDHIPGFLDSSSFVINNNRLAYYDGSPVHKGQNMTLNWQVKIKDSVADGTYNLVLSLVREFDEWGYRVNSDGSNHMYRSILWKFAVGSAVPTSHPTVFDFNSIKVGDTVGTMKVVSISPVVSSQPFGPWNASIKFSGSVTLTGRFQYISDDFGIGRGAWLDELDASSLARLPMASHSPPLSSSSMFYFGNIDYVRQVFGPMGSSGLATIVVDDYTLVLLESEIPHSIKITKVIDKQIIVPVYPGWKTYTSQKLKVGLSYPPKATWGSPEGQQNDVYVREELVYDVPEVVFKIGGYDNLSIARYEKATNESVEDAINRLFPGPPGLPLITPREDPYNPRSFVILWWGHDFPPEFQDIRLQIFPGYTNPPS